MTVSGDLAVASTFSGVGGIDLGFHAAGIPTRLLCEYDKHAASVLARRFPGVPIHPDVTELTADDLAAAGLVPERTILAGGFPCQDLSIAGARRGMGEGTRSGLYWHLDRLMAEFRPAWVVFENVPGLLSSNGGRDMGAVLGSLADRGYGFAYRVLDAQFFGVPQRRRRVVIVGRLGDSGAAPAQVLLEPEGGGWDSPAGDKARAGAARNFARGPRRAGREVVSTLQTSGGDRGYRVDAEAAAGGHLIPATFQKVIRSGERDAEGNLPPEVWAQRDVAATLNLHDLGSCTRAVDVVVQPTLSRTGVSTTDPRAGMGIGDETDPMFTLQAGRTHGIAVTTLGDRTRTLTGQGHDASEDGTGRGTPIVAFHLTQDPISSDTVVPSLGAKSTGQGIQTETTVRRLTPIECERLQGFPDAWTEGQADSHRYKQMGNGVAVPVFEWVAHRLAAVHRAGDRS